MVRSSYSRRSHTSVPVTKVHNNTDKHGRILTSGAGQGYGKSVVDIDSDGSRGGGYGLIGKELMRRRGRTKSSGYTAGRRLTNHRKKSMVNMPLEVPASGGRKKHTGRR